MPKSATAVAPGFTDTLVANIGSPTSLAFTPDGRLLVTTQFGTLRIVQNGSLLPSPALDLGAVLCTDNERGLLGEAVDPSFTSNGFVYLYYTRNKSGTCVNRVSRFTMSGSTISLATESVLVDEIPTPSGNHNGGDLRFGKDGLLYVSVGDGACDYAGGGCYGQNDASRDQHALIGKILRITSTGGIPPTNPFQGAGTARCNVTGADDGRKQVPGDLRVGIPEPVPDRVRPQHDRNALLRQRRRRRNLGGGRRGPGRRRLRLECPRRALRQRVDDELRRAAGGHDEPGLRVLARRVRVPRDHRWRLRPERHLARVVRRHVPVRGLHLRQGLRPHSERKRRLHAERVRRRRRCGRQHDLRAVAAGPGALLHELHERRSGAPDRVDGLQQPAADRASDRDADLRPASARRELRREREHRPGRG